MCTFPAWPAPASPPARLPGRAGPCCSPRSSLTAHPDAAGVVGRSEPQGMFSCLMWRGSIGPGHPQNAACLLTAELFVLLPARCQGGSSLLSYMPPGPYSLSVSQERSPFPRWI